MICHQLTNDVITDVINFGVTGNEPEVALGFILQPARDSSIYLQRVPSFIIRRII